MCTNIVYIQANSTKLAADDVAGDVAGVTASVVDDLTEDTFGEVVMCTMEHHELT